MLAWFEMWDRLGRDPVMLMQILGLFGYDDAFMADILTCCDLLDFQRRHRTLQDIFGDIFSAEQGTG